MSEKGNCGSRSGYLEKSKKRIKTKRFTARQIRQIRRISNVEGIIFLLCFVIGFGIGAFLLKKAFDFIISVFTILGSEVILIFLKKKISRISSLLKKNITKLIVVIFAGVIIGIIAKLNGIDARLVNAVNAFFEVSNEKNSDGRRNKKEKDILSKNLVRKVMDEGEKKWLEGQEVDNLNGLNKIMVSSSDLVYASELKMSKDIYNLVFFQGGLYCIKDWTDEKEILLKVKKMIETIRNKKRKNILKIKGEQWEKDEISEISDKEEEDIEKNLEIELKDKMDDTDKRINYFAKLPCADLANLIANAYHLYGLIAFCYNFPQDAKLYYYVKAIEYELEFISFDGVSNEVVKKRLIWIATRYKDIAFTCEDAGEVKWAEKLGQAFNSLSHEY